MVPGRIVERPMPSGRSTALQPVPSCRKVTAGRTTRPGCTVTVPSTAVLVPTGKDRACAMDTTVTGTGVAVGRGVFVGRGVAVGRGVEPGVVGRAVGLGVTSV